MDANTALAHFGYDEILPCEYKFPVATFEEAIVLASTFTNVVLGTLQDVIEIFAQNGDAPLTRHIASVIGQEGEQQGYYRLLQKLRPNELPFLTTSTRDFAFTAIQSFTVSGTCPNQNQIALQTFEPLTLLSTPSINSTTMRFSFVAPWGFNETSFSVVYINQQNLPIVETIEVLSIIGSVVGDTVTIEALFPYEEYEMNGFTIAAVTNSTGPFASADAVATATVYGPAFIQIN